MKKVIGFWLLLLGANVVALVAFNRIEADNLTMTVCCIAINVGAIYAIKRSRMGDEFKKYGFKALLVTMLGLYGLALFFVLVVTILSLVFGEDPLFFEHSVRRIMVSSLLSMLLMPIALAALFTPQRGK